MPFSFVTPQIVQKILDSLDGDTKLTPEASEVISEIFNYHTEAALRSAHRSAANRAAGDLSSEVSNAKLTNLGTNPDGTAPVDFLSPLDQLAAQLEVSDIMKRLQLPPDCNISLTSAEDTDLFGPIKPFHPPASVACASIATRSPSSGP